MRPTADSWTIVITGAWNSRLFTPEWVSRNIFENDQLNIEMGVGTGVHAWRFLSGALIFVPSEDRIVFGTSEASPEKFADLERLAMKLLELLPHTPITGVGMNFGFACDEPSETLLAIFNTTDSRPLGLREFEIVRSEVARALRRSELLQVINLKLISLEGRVLFEFNHHFAATTAADARAQLGALAIPAHTVTLEILDSVYELRNELETD